MMLRAKWVVSAVMLLATAAHAEMRTPDRAGWSPYLRQDLRQDLIRQVSDFVEPYAELPPQLPPPRYARALLPPLEVYTVLREAGFSPLGMPRLRGNIWSIAAINRDGDDGRLFIDASNGRILRFMPAGDRFDDEAVAGLDDRQAAPPRPLPMPPMRGVQRPPAVRVVGPEPVRPVLPASG